MKIKRKVASFVLAVSVMCSVASIGASASKLYTTQTATRKNVDYTYGMNTPHYEKDLIYNYYGTKRTIGKLYSRAYAGGFWRWSTEAQAGAGYAGGSAHPYASIVINGTTRSVSENTKSGIEWTDWKETATSWTNYSVVFKIHCWY